LLGVAERSSPGRLGFDPEQVHVRFLVIEWHWDRLFSEIFGIPLENVISPVLYAYCDFARRTSGRNPETLKHGIVGQRSDFTLFLDSAQ
jgi:hypothetical protein